jgi:acyl-CoA synthetase (AMP-forming)/AMP-acid ligase II
VDSRLIAEFDGGPALAAPATWTELLQPWVASDAPAVRQPDSELSYRGLLRMAGAATELLDELGTSAGSPVPALLDSGPVALALWLAGASSMRPIAPLGPRGTVAEVVACIQPGDAKVLLASPAHRELGEAAAARVGARCVVVDGLGGADPPDLTRAAPDDVACILHTSGTTGRPKRILIRQRALAARVRAYIHALAVDEHSVYASAASFHHAAGAPFLVVALGAGAAVTPMPTRFSIQAWRRLGALGVTHSNVVPSMLEMLLDAGALDADGLRLQTLLYGASRIEPEQIRRTFAVLPDVRLVQGYGQTEGGPHTVLDTADHHLGVSDPARAEVLTSCGRPAPGVRIRIVGEPGKSGGTVGVIQVRSPQVFAPGDDGWLTTGDLGRFDADGYLYLVGRTGDGFIRGGENIHPAEIERVLLTHPGVRDAAVVGVPDVRLGQTVGALVVPVDPARPPATAELHSHVRRALAGFKVPAVWEFLPELPRSETGKLLRNRLPVPKETA